MTGRHEFQHIDRSIQGKGRIAGEMASALGSLRKFRAYLWFMAGAMILSGVLRRLGVMEGSGSTSPADISFIYFGLASFLALAAFFVEKKPVAWTLACAAVLTFVNSAILIKGVFPGVLPILVCTMALVCVPKARTLEKLLIMYPDLRFARRLREKQPPVPEKHGSSLPPYPP